MQYTIEDKETVETTETPETLSDILVATMTGAEDAVPRAALQLLPIPLQRVAVPIVGISPFIPHKFPEKAKRQMLEKMQGASLRAKRDPKDPQAEADAATYYLRDGRFGAPATAFKSEIVGAARFFEGVKMTVLKRCLYVFGEGVEQLVPLEGEKELHEDTPRNATGVVDLRYRNYIFPWRTTLTIRFVATILSAESVVNLVSAAGMGGIGDWRPSAPKSNSGTFGMWELDKERQILLLEEQP